MRKIVSLFDLPKELQNKNAEKISEITHNEPKMLSLSPSEIFSRRFVALMLDENDEIISMVAVFEPEANADGLMLGEVGMMYTDKSLRGHGIGHLMYKYAEEWARKQEDYDGFVAFLCEASIGIFSEAGFAAENAESVLPKSFFDICLDHCYLNPKAEHQAESFVELVEIATARNKAVEEYKSLCQKYKSLGEKGALPLKILEENAHRARLCCPLPAYKIFEKVV